VKKRKRRVPAARRPSALGVRVIICGGRDYADRDTFMRAMDRIDAEHGPIHCVVHGAARGADTLAKFWAHSNERPETPVPAKWRLYGPAAGPIRNAEMLDILPDLVIAFPGGRGTANMVEQTRNRALPIIHVAADGGIRLEKPRVANGADSGNLELCLKASPSPSTSR
jgi:YspA, cpYpsA-related SLOG family